jgi:hypothetical protein
MGIDLYDQDIGANIFYRSTQDYVQCCIQGPDRLKLLNLNVEQGIRFCIEHAFLENDDDCQTQQNIAQLLRREDVYFVVFDKTIRREFSQHRALIADGRKAPINDEAFFHQAKDAQGKTYWLLEARVHHEQSETMG